MKSDMWPVLLYSPFGSPCFCIFIFFFLFTVTSLGCQRKDSGSFNVRCQENQHIYIVNAILERRATPCWKPNTCCPSAAICEVFASAEHVQRLKESCDGQQQCSVTLTTGECYFYLPNGDPLKGSTDYESVKYFCVNNRPGKFFCCM